MPPQSSMNATAVRARLGQAPGPDPSAAALTARAALCLDTGRHVVDVVPTALRWLLEPPVEHVLAKQSVPTGARQRAGLVALAGLLAATGAEIGFARQVAGRDQHVAHLADVLVAGCNRLGRTNSISAGEGACRVAGVCLPNRDTLSTDLLHPLQSD